MSISSKSSKKEIYGRVRRSDVSVRGNMDTRVLNLKKSMVDKGLRENKIMFDKIEKYSSRRGRGRSTKRLSNIEIPVVTGGYNNRKSIKNMKTMKTRKTMKTGKK